MIGGLPLGTWVLMASSTVPGLILVVLAYRVHRGADIGRGGGGRDVTAPDGGTAPETGPQEGRERGPEAPQARREGGGDDG